MDADRLARLSNAHARQRDTLITRLIASIVPFWRQVRNFHDPSQVGAASAASAFRVTAAQVQSRRQFRAYSQQVLREMDVTDPFPDQWDYYSRSGVTPLTVWDRPAGQGVFGYSQGETFEGAQQRVLERVADLAEADVMLAQRDEEQRVYGALERVVGYRRIIHPELSRSGTCGLCAVAATQRYHTDQLRDLHDGDHCDTAPIVGTEDPGQVLNSADLDQLYAAAGQAAAIGGQQPAKGRSTATEDLLNVRITVGEHGEKGPVLIKQGDHFRTHSQADAPAFRRPTADEVRRRKTAAYDDATQQLAAAQDELAHVRNTSPGSSDQVAAARRVRNLQELQRSLNYQLQTAEAA
jgi:hypothetical protein